MSSTNRRATRPGAQPAPRQAPVGWGYVAHRVVMGKRAPLAPGRSRLRRATAYATMPVMASARFDQRLIVRLCVVFALALGVLVLAASVLTWLGYALVWLWNAGALILPPGVGL